MFAIFDWLTDLVGGVGDMVSSAVSSAGEMLSQTILDSMLQWYCETIYNAVADFFARMGNMGAELFDLSWVSATVQLFTLFGWSLFVAGMVVAVFDVAVESRNNSVDIKSTALNILKGFFACSLIGVVPIDLYKFCVTLQNVFMRDISSMVASSKSVDLAEVGLEVLQSSFSPTPSVKWTLLLLVSMIAYAYCVVKIFFANIKRGGILLVQIAVGSLYMFSVPRGYQDGFNQWIKQVIAICLTAFLQTTLLYLGMLTFTDNMLLGLGVMLSANEVPRIAQQFGLDSSVKVNVTNVMHATTTAVNLTRTIASAIK